MCVHRCTPRRGCQSSRHSRIDNGSAPIQVRLWLHVSVHMGRRRKYVPASLSLSLCDGRSSAQQGRSRIPCSLTSYTSSHSPTPCSLTPYASSRHCSVGGASEAAVTRPENEQAQTQDPDECLALVRPAGLRCQHAREIAGPTGLVFRGARRCCYPQRIRGGGNGDLVEV